MSVCSVTRRHDNTGSNEAQRNNLLYEVRRTQYTVAFNVKCTSHLDGPQVVMSSALLPTLGNAYAFGNDADVLATCVKVTVPKRQSRRLWLVEATYDTDRIVAQYTDNPFQQPPVISGGTIPYEIAMRRDAIGRPIINSAGRPFDPPPTVDEKAGIITVTRNEPSTALQAATYGLPVFTTATADRYRMTCNSVTWNGRVAYTCRMNEIKFALELSFGRLFWQVTYEIEIRPKRKFYSYLMDMSWTDYADRPFRDPATGFVLANQTLLNGRGDRLKLAVDALSAGVTNVAVNVPVVGGDGLGSNIAAFFPYPEAFSRQTYFIKVDDEIMEVIGYVDDFTFIVNRGAEGSTAAAHSSGAGVTMEPYFLRFQPHLTEDFNNLNLPVLP